MIVLISMMNFFLSFGSYAAGDTLGHGPSDHGGGVSLRLTGVYVHDEVMYYRVFVRNHSHLVYDVDLLRFSMRDRRQVRRHAYQEVILSPIWIRGDSLRVPPGGRAVWWVALPKEVPSSEQYLSITMLERHGSRNLRVSVRSRSILSARIVKEM